jgi:ribosomal protein S18 acetylase RimI-like enzyme
MFAAAFAADPILAWWQNTGRDRRMRMFQHLLARVGQQNELLLLGSPSGARAICAVSDGRGNWFKVIQSTFTTFWEYRAFTGPSGWAHLFLVSLILMWMHPSKRFIHIQYFAVPEEQRGRGLGVALLDEIAELAGTLGAQCYLEAGSEASIQYFKRRGWVVSSEHILPCSGPKVCGMQYRLPITDATLPDRTA